MGSYSRLKRSIVLLFVSIFIFNISIMSFRSHAALPLLAPAASTALRLFTVVVTKRIVQKAANDATYTILKTGTQRGLTSALQSMSTRLGAGSVYKTSTGMLTWLGAGALLTPNDISVNNLTGSNIVVATTAIDMGDGTYRIDYDGKTYYSDFMPTPENPFVAVKTANENTELADTVTSLLSSHKYYMNNPGADGYIVGSPYSVAYTYIKTLMNNKKLTCGAVSNKNCNYGSIAIDLKQPTGTLKSYTFKFSYTYFSTSNSGELKEVTVSPAVGYTVNYNSQYIPSETPEEEIGYVTPSEETGFIELEELKNNPVNLDALLALMNELLMEAASESNYEGIPFDSTNPITKEELNQALKENNLTVSEFDLLHPMGNASNGFQFPNYSNTGSNSSSNSNNEPDYSHPSVTEPNLEDIPTAEMILNPLKQFFPFLSNLDLGARDVSCPIAQFNVFDKSVMIDSHCPLIEQNRSLFSLISLILWSFLALRVVLTA